MELLDRLTLPEDIKGHIEPLIKSIPEGHLVTYEKAADSYFHRIKTQHSRNELIDLQTAQELHLLSLFLLKKYPDLPPDDQKLAAAAVRYFLMSHGKEHDLGSVDGFEDDVEAMNAVLDALGFRGRRIAYRV